MRRSAGLPKPAWTRPWLVQTYAGNLIENSKLMQEDAYLCKPDRSAWPSPPCKLCSVLATLRVLLENSV